jgi:Chlorophyll A-B binding protein
MNDSNVRVQVDRSKDTLFFASEQSLSYLDGSLPADYGFDPLGLSDPEGAGGFVDPKWLAYRCDSPSRLGDVSLAPAPACNMRASLHVHDTSRHRTKATYAIVRAAAR